MRNIILFLIVAIPLLLLIYLSLQTKNTPENSIRIGINQWPGFGYLFIAKKEGFFKEAGLNIELVELSSLVEVRRAFERGKVDGMAATSIELLEAYKYSRRIAQAIIIIDYSNGADVILGSPQVNTLDDLRGKKIGVENGSLSLYMTLRALELNAIKQSEVTMVSMDLHDMLHSLRTEKVDAIYSYIPESEVIKKQFSVNHLFDSSDIPGEIIDIIAIDQDVLLRFPELQTKLQQVWARTLEYVMNNPENAYNILTARIPISINEFRKYMRYVYLVGPHEQFEFLKPRGKLQQNLNKIGSIVYSHTKNDLDYSQFVYNKNL